MAKEKNLLVWIDLEMTGLNPDDDKILEIATLITNNDLAVVAEGPDLVINQPQHILDRMNEVVTKMHTASGLLEQVRTSTITLEQAQVQTFDFIRQHCPIHSAPLCGNTVYQDRLFLRRYMPPINSYLHYRIVDVSSIKELVDRWYARDPRREFKKKDTHRALDDIKESIEELRHYRQYFFKA